MLFGFIWNGWCFFLQVLFLYTRKFIRIIHVAAFSIALGCAAYVALAISITS